MVDFWEVLGRLVTNDQFRGDMFGKFTTGAYTIDSPRSAILPEDHYNQAKAIVASVMDRPVSLMALGELLYAMSFTEFRRLISDLAARTNSLVGGAAGRDQFFHMTLGAIIVDDQLRGVLMDRQSFEGVKLGIVPAGDRDALVSLRSDAVFVRTATALCEEFWNPKCFAKMFFWTAHAHPVANAPRSANPPQIVP